MFSIVLILLPLALFYYVYSYYRWVAKYPKGPTPLPFIGNIHQLKSGRIYQNIERFSKEHGALFTLFMPNPTVIITDYELIREAYMTNGDNFSDRPDHKASEIFTYCENGGVINSNGKNWKEQQRTSLTILRDFGMGKNLMEEKVKLSIQEYLRYLNNVTDKDRVDMRWPIQLMISNVICETLFGFSYEYDNCKELIDYVEQVNKMLRDFSKTKMLLLLTKWPWIRHVPYIGYYAFHQHKNNVVVMNQFIDKQVKRASMDYDQEHEPTCFVHAYKQKMLHNTYLNEDQLRACCWDFFFAGQESTTTTLRWGMLYMADNLVVQEKVRAEILSVAGTSRLPSMNDKPNMPYTAATVLEIQRVANIIAINVMRKTTVETEIRGFKIPANTCVTADIHYILAHDPIFDDPIKFQPERFLNADGKTLNKQLIDHCIPFSIGKRVCAGESMARVELFLGLVSTLQHYKILPPLNGKLDLEPIMSGILMPQTNYLRLIPLLQ